MIFYYIYSVAGIYCSSHMKPNNPLQHTLKIFTIIYTPVNAIPSYEF